MLSKNRKDGSECEMVTFLGVYRIGAREEIVLRWNGSPSACFTILHQKGKGLDSGHWVLCIEKTGKAVY